MTSARTAREVEMQRWVRIVPIKFEPGPGKTLEEAVNINIFVLGSLADFPDPVADLPIVEEDAF